MNTTPSGDSIKTLSPGLLLHAYSIGVFPMADSADDPEVFWVEPHVRGVLPLDGLHLSRSLRKTVRQDRFTVTINQAFEAVIDGCAAATPDRPSTWINDQIRTAVLALHDAGYAHSVESWTAPTPDHPPQLVGGLYGIALNGAFFGESMFSRQTDASKVALVHLVARLRHNRYKLLDTQFSTSHLETLGVIEMTKQAYQKQLQDALAYDCTLAAPGMTFPGKTALEFLR